ncbi:MAG: hypothetical protein JXA19_04895 [Anaerolineales bacterium]|nr:hypothetical protein [Anaerolineales bacterium]
MRISKRRQFLLLSLIVLLVVSCTCQPLAYLLAKPAKSSIPLQDLQRTPSPTSLPSDYSIETIPDPHTNEDSIGPTPTLTVLQKSDQLAVFEELWRIVNEEYLYSDFNGLDWDLIHHEMLEKINGGLSTEDFYYSMAEMIYSLGDDHSVFMDPQLVAEMNAEFEGNNDYVGIGIYHQAVPDESFSTVILTFPDSPAEKVGIQPHDLILAINGTPLIDEDGVMTDLLLGPADSSAVYTIQTPGQEPRDLLIERQRITSAIPIPNSVLTTPDGKHIGYIILPTFNDQTIAKSLEQVIKTMTEEYNLSGIIIDDRVNDGGTDYIYTNTIRLFVSGVVGYFVNRTSDEEISVRPLDINGSQTIPLVVLVGKGTASFGEVFAGVLQDLDRAYIIGETTDGNVEILYGYDFKDGSQVWIAHDTYRPPNDLTLDWEGDGIVPDEEVISAWHLFTTETDPAILKALEYFDQ